MYILSFFLSLFDDEDNSDYFKYLFLRYQEKMFHSALKITRDEMKAEDAVQETFYKLATTEGQIPWLKSFQYTEREEYTLLYLCKQMACTLIGRACYRREELLEYSEENIRAYSKNKNFTTTEILIGDEEGDPHTLGKIAWAMSKLPDDYSTILMLFYYYNFKPDQVAKEMGCTKNTVYVKKSRAIKRLKAIYEKAIQEGIFEVWER